jgi:tetratricopeptide (TPR) repeat protein
MDLSTLGPATALPEYLAALELDKETGAKGDLLNILNGIGIARGMLDDFAAADAAFVESLAVAQQLGAYNAVTRISQANTAILEGRLARAAALAEQAASDARKRGDKDIEIAAQIVRFQTMLLARNFAGAQSCLDQVRAIARGAKLPTATVALWNLSAASLSRLTGNLDRAASQLHQAKSVDEPFLSAELGEEQIELFLAQRNYKEAQHAAISLLASLANTGRKSAMARVAALLSDSYGYDGELTGARETAKTASSLLSSHSAPLARIMVLTSLVRWQENRSLAAHCLAEALALAKECGFRFAEHDARQPPAMLGMISNSHTNK